MREEAFIQGEVSDPFLFFGWTELHKLFHQHQIAHQQIINALGIAFVFLTIKSPLDLFGQLVIVILKEFDKLIGIDNIHQLRCILEIMICLLFMLVGCGFGEYFLVYNCQVGLNVLFWQFDACLF